MEKGPYSQSISRQNARCVFAWEGAGGPGNSSGGGDRMSGNQAIENKIQRSIIRVLRKSKVRIRMEVSDKGDRGDVNLEISRIVSVADIRIALWLNVIFGYPKQRDGEIPHRHPQRKGARKERPHG